MIYRQIMKQDRLAEKFKQLPTLDENNKVAVRIHEYLLRDRNFANPKMNIEKIAEDMNVSFSYLYQAMFCISQSQFCASTSCNCLVKQTIYRQVSHKFTNSSFPFRDINNFLHLLYFNGFYPPSFFIKSLPTSNIRIFLLDYVASKY